MEDVSHAGGRVAGGRVLRADDAFRHLPSSVQPHANAVDLHVLSDDGMMTGGDDTHYLLVGATALNAILAALALAKAPAPKKLLDFGSGAGRVLRWIRAAFPNTSIDACDLREQDVQFCATQFGARTWQSGTEIDAMEADGGYDLVWAGSVLTHLPPLACAQLLDKLLSWCAPGGLLVFTTVGRVAAGRPQGEKHYHPEWSSIRQQYVTDGSGYADYSGSPGYGLALAKPSWYVELIEANADVRLVMAAEAAWDDHQDVWAIQKKPIGSMLDPNYARTSAAGQGTSTFEAGLRSREAGRTSIGSKLSRWFR